jgi:hypothetical protein
MKGQTMMKQLGWSCALPALLLVASVTRADDLTVLVDVPLTQSQAIYTFNTNAFPLPVAPGTVPISGLDAGDRLLSIDYRPATGELYGLGAMSALYTVNPLTGAASKVGTGFTNPLVGTQFGFDFNPDIDRIRIVGDADSNFVAHPTTGNANVAVTTPVAYGAADPNFGINPNVVHHAYNNNELGMADITPPTLLHAIDTNLGVLVTQTNNAGVLTTIGSLGVAGLSDEGGFDISTTGNAYAAFQVDDLSSNLYSINLSTGSATLVGSLPVGVSGLAAVPIPEPSTLAVLAVAIAALAVRRHRS